MGSSSFGQLPHTSITKKNVDKENKLLHSNRQSFQFNQPVLTYNGSNGSQAVNERSNTHKISDDYSPEEFDVNVPHFNSQKSNYGHFRNSPSHYWS